MSDTLLNISNSSMKVTNFSKIVYNTAGRDLRGLILLKKTEFALNKLRKKNATLSTMFQEVVNKNAEKVAIIHQDKQWTFSDLNEFSNKVANAFIKAGYKAGDEVALLMESCPEFVGIWLGLSKVGIITALLNTNLKRKTLENSINIINTKAFIFDSSLSQAVRDLLSSSHKEKKFVLYSYGECDIGVNKERLDLILENTDSKNIPLYKGNFTDKLLYIYTSGTTGFPKAAIIKHSRFFVFGVSIHNTVKIKSNDILYTALPLYHLAGGVLGLSQCLLYGTSIVIRHKFSASSYWNDCAKHKCTVAQYIGEICRYLLSHEINEDEKKHRIHTMFGNGLRPQIWSQFKTRFGIKNITEFYGSTEGSGNLVNIDNREGACGFIPITLPYWIFRYIYPVNLIKVDPETGEPIRDKDGLCQVCLPGECGQFVGKIKNNDLFCQFDGYIDHEASKKKIINDVFEKGDKAYASGDLLTMDKYGYLYFSDRTGDNIRWKGENISTSEIEAVISNYSNLTDCVVYGVKIPGHEGKAAMAAINDPNHNLNLKILLENLKKTLPRYSIPLFIRLVDKMEITSTFKLSKLSLQKEGFDIKQIKDPIYILDSKTNNYNLLNDDTYKKLRDGLFLF